PQDYDELRKMGVACVFGPGTRLPTCANQILDVLEGNDKNENESKRASA
uniref:Methylmalonyl-CoA mutase n=2 Tax=Panagrolaimus sp. PS1159 TaxID=55785 RepID=A0AC35GXG6_9BILA